MVISNAFLLMGDKMKKIISYILLISWMILIFILSNQTADVSGNNSSGIIYSVLEFIYNIFNIDKSNLNDLVYIINIPLREVMHMVEYLVLGILVCNVLNIHDVKNMIIISISLCFIYSVSDEIHQIFVKGRAFELFDIFMDMLGSYLGSIIFKFIKNKIVD